MTFENAAPPLLDHTIRPFSPLLQRLRPEQLQALQEACKPLSPIHWPSYKP